MLDEAREELKGGALEAEGDTEPSLRIAIQTAVAGLVRGSRDGLESLDDTLRPYVEAVALHAHLIDDEHLSQLRAAGFSEAAIFEVTVNAAVAAGLERLAMAMDVWRRP